MMDAAHGESAPQLSAEDKRTLLRIARRSLIDYLGGGRLPVCPTDSPAFLVPRAVFVTLRHRETGKLRGCRGESVARQPLVESVADMAIAAATDDPRFPPVTLDEVSDLQIEISMLSPMRPIRPDDVVVGRHGLMIVRGRHRGLLLPQVPEAHGWDREAFLRWTCRKAGLPETDWQLDDTQLYAFECAVWEEEK